MNVQERLQLKRIPLDKWSNREQLCLAWAVLCSGDQNWMSVSRALKMMCGNNRPSDWFSQKFCAAQYGKLLENVETPKRKKRTATERDNPTSADVTTIIPGELIVRRLVQERVAELRKLVEDDQKEFRQLAQDVRLLQSDSLDDTQVLAMWEQIENENREKEQEQLKHTQWLREREERKIEMERAWRPGVVIAASMSPTSNSNSSGSPSRNSPSLFLKTAGANITKVEPMDQQSEASANIVPGTPFKPGTSPLLTSLLKSPSSQPSTPPTIPNSSVSSTRTLAPTITNLLTGGTGQQVGTSSLNSPGFSGAQNVAHSGSTFFNFPSKHPQHQQTSAATTPSKAAPTLSKLLDASRKNNANGGASAITDSGNSGGDDSNATSAVTTEVVVATDDDVINIDDQQLMEVFKELMPDDLADILTDHTGMIVTPELLDQDLENVQQIMQPGTISGSSTTAVAALAHNLTPVVAVVDISKRGSNANEETTEIMAPKNDYATYDHGQPVSELQEQNDPGHREDIPPEIIPQKSTTPTQEDDNDEVMMDIEETTPSVELDSQEVHEQIDEVTEEVRDNLEEQLAAITNGGQSAEEEQLPAVVVQDGPNESLENTTAAEKGLDGQDQVHVIEENEEVEEAELQDNVCKDQEEKNVDQKNSSGPILSETALGEDNQSAEASVLNAESDFKHEMAATEVEESLIDIHKKPDDAVKSAPVVDRKVSTDNEDQFEDAKSDIGDSGNPPEDVEMGLADEKVEKLEEELPSVPVTSNVAVTACEGQKGPSESGTEVNNTPEAPDRSSRSKREMPRRNRSQTSSAGGEDKLEKRPVLMEDSGEETKSSSASNISLRARLKERERSESPLVMDEDTSDLAIPRTRRRTSSTPVIDSVPSSPASGDDREYKNWKKTVLIAFNQFSTLHYKYSAVLVQQVPEEFKPIILRPMDMQTIKKNIETGVIRSTAEFQRDILLMVQNAIMMNTRQDRDWTNLINEMLGEVNYWKRETEKNLNSRESDSSTGGSSQGKVRNRKSMRITTAS